jgi:hypothetical protein
LSDTRDTTQIPFFRDRQATGQLALDALSRYSVVFALSIALILVLARP